MYGRNGKKLFKSKLASVNLIVGGVLIRKKGLKHFPKINYRGLDKEERVETFSKN